MHDQEQEGRVGSGERGEAAAHTLPGRACLLLVLVTASSIHGQEQAGTIR